MPITFISYRRSDTSHVAHRMYDRLVSEFGKQSVFIDVDTIKPGSDFEDVIDEYLKRCDCMLVLIGNKWRGKAAWWKRARIMRKGDLVRYEVAAALKRGIRVIPLLEGSTDLPNSKMLPEDLLPLRRRQHYRLRADQHFHTDMGSIVSAINMPFDVSGPSPLSAKLKTSVALEVTSTGWAHQDFGIDEPIGETTEFYVHAHTERVDQIFAVYYHITSAIGSYWIGFTNRVDGFYKIGREYTDYWGQSGKTSYEFVDSVASTIGERFPELKGLERF